MFYDKLFSSLDFTLPRAANGRRGFPKEAMVCPFIVMKCEGFTQITDLMDYLDNKVQEDGKTVAIWKSTGKVFCDDSVDALVEALGIR